MTLAPAVFAIIRHPEARTILAVTRTRADDLGFPGGKVEPGETFEAAVVREVLEETGLKLLEVEGVYTGVTPGKRIVHAFVARKWNLNGFLHPEPGHLLLWVTEKRMLDPRNVYCRFYKRMFDEMRVKSIVW